MLGVAVVAPSSGRLWQTNLTWKKRGGSRGATCGLQDMLIANTT